MALHLFAGICVSDYQAALPWYERLLGSEPSFLPHATEAVWELAEHRAVYIVEDAKRAGHSVQTLFVDDLDPLVAEIAARGIEPAERGRTPTACARSPTATPTATRWDSAADRAEPFRSDRRHQRYSTARGSCHARALEQWRGTRQTVITARTVRAADSATLRGLA